MNLGKAIEIVDYNLETYPHLKHEAFGDAMKLLIEAGKYTLACRLKGYHPVEHSLPGETE